MEQVQSDRLLIIDGHAYAYRAFHAIRRLEGPGGRPTNAIFGFIKMLERMRVAHGPSHLVVIWDGGLAAERMAELPEYKAQRPPMPDSLETQIKEIEEYLGAAHICTLCEDGIEADDWIATVALEFSALLPVLIASSDKDFMQLVSARIGLINPNDKTDRIWAADEVMAKAGVSPKQIVDWLSLIGDAVDNIPGVPGVGPKTAADLLQQFGSLEAILAGLEEIKSLRLRAAVSASADILMRNRRLIELRRVNRPVPLDEMRLREPQVERLRELYERWGFKGLRAALEERTKSEQQQALL
jgi:DNA polymerase-1